MLDGDIVRVTCNFELGDGTQYQNVYHYIRDGTDVISDGNHVAAIKAAMEQMYAEIAGLVLDDVTEQLSFVDRVEFNEIVDEWRVVENIGTFTPEFTPTSTDEGLPYQSSAYVVFKTGRPKTVGKKYLFPFSETAQNETVMTGGALAAVVAYAVEALEPRAVGGDVTLTPGVPRTGVQSFFNFLVAVANDLLGSQKRRRPGVGA